MILTVIQTVDNACASVALLNIVNNIPSIDLGENLRQFKQFTRNFTPALRGDAIGNFEFVKQIHNTFARSVWRTRLPAAVLDVRIGAIVTAFLYTATMLQAL